MMDGATSIDCGMKVIVAKFYEYSIHGSEHWTVPWIWWFLKTLQFFLTFWLWFFH